MIASAARLSQIGVNADNIPRKQSAQLPYDGKSLAKESQTVNVCVDSIENAKGHTAITFRLRRNGEIVEAHVPPGRLGFEFRPAPPNMPAPWDPRYYMKPKGVLDFYPYENKKRDKWK